MGRDATGDSFLQGVLGKVLRRKPAEAPVPQNTPLAMLERLHTGERPDYCLYLRPPAGGPVVKEGLLSIDIEELLTKAFDPLPVIGLDETPKGAPDARLPDEAFLTLANHARLLCLVPTAHAHFLSRLKLLKQKGPLGRCVFLMPEAGTLGTADWPALWPAAREAAGTLGIELSAYTAGGWLFRLDGGGNACTFRPIVNPNPEKIARALEAICVEMG
ncbi:MAG TPA: hypothetical protein VG269_21505 [Tepidisphaeraceae bacterium]|jgi:hypothetical protein|nr:hypothetical protein [Tepidisphaeraceae bacterium]